MLLNSNTDLRRLITVYLNSKKEPEAVEVSIEGNKLEGRGYVVRHVRKNGRLLSMLDFRGITLAGKLPAGLYDLEHAVCEKVFGDIRIEIADDQSMFPDEEDN